MDKGYSYGLFRVECSNGFNCERSPTVRDGNEKPNIQRCLKVVVTALINHEHHPQDRQIWQYQEMSLECQRCHSIMQNTYIIHKNQM